MEFEFCISKDAWLRAYIFQQNNLKYVKIVIDHFDERQGQDIRLVRIVEGVFNAVDNNVDIQLCTLSTVDDLDVFFVYPWGRVGYRRLLHEFQGSWARKFQKAKRRQVKEITYMVHGFPIAIQVWAYKALLKIMALFGQQLHMYATLRPTDAEAEQPYFSTLVPYDDLPVSMLDDIARTVVALQFNASYADTKNGRQSAMQGSDNGVACGGSGEDETSGDDNGDGQSGSDCDSDDTKDTVEGAGD
ncbi:Hypothetical predicted protein [Olea europaea subsp. europaea]|uniref:Uncharacterized protein n=1 Tax=Olea europaea subsp. europaea TaxID=158383 RepID=A0A8S0T390_OLEEU|nr:Hypothetical predicted protein [Olea europaea subsp. europaea]